MSRAGAKRPMAQSEHGRFPLPAGKRFSLPMNAKRLPFWGLPLAKKGRLAGVSNPAKLLKATRKGPVSYVIRKLLDPPARGSDFFCPRNLFCRPFFSGWSAPPAGVERIRPTVRQRLPQGYGTGQIDGGARCGPACRLTTGKTALLVLLPVRHVPRYASPPPYRTACGRSCYNLLPGVTNNHQQPPNGGASFVLGTGASALPLDMKSPLSGVAGRIVCWPAAGTPSYLPRIQVASSARPRWWGRGVTLPTRLPLPAGKGKRVRSVTGSSWRKSGEDASWRVHLCACGRTPAACAPHKTGSYPEPDPIRGPVRPGQKRFLPRARGAVTAAGRADLAGGGLALLHQPQEPDNDTPYQERVNTALTLSLE